MASAEFRKWIGGLVSALASGVSGVLAVNFIDPHDFNLENPGKLVQAAIAFGVVGVVNYLKEHPAPGEDRVTPRGWYLPLLLAGAVTASACAGSTPAPVVNQPSAEQVQATRAKAMEIATAVESVGGVVVEAGRATSAAYQAGLITRAQHDAVHRAIVALEAPTLALIDIAKTVTTDPQLRSTVTAFVGVLDGLLSALESGNGAMATVAKTIRAGLSVVAAYAGGDL